MERLLLSLFVPALLLTALLWPEERTMRVVILAATLVWSGVAAFRGGREYLAQRREFGGKTLAEQHRQAVDPALARAIGRSLQTYPPDTRVNVLPKRSWWRHQFYYETYPYLIVDSTATNAIHLAR